MEDMGVKTKAVCPGHAVVLTLLAVLLTLDSLASPAGPRSAAQAGQIAQKPLQYEVTVVLKLIHVYVTDKKGNPVPDLAVSDFTVTDNGQPMKVTDFERRVLRAAPSAAPAEAPAPAPPPAKKTEQALTLGRDENRKFFLYFDFAYNNPRGITKARKAALHFLTTDVTPGDEVALVSYSMLKGFIVHEYLTTDHAKVQKAIEDVGQKEIVGRADEVEEQYWQQATEGLRDWENSRGATEAGEIGETNIKRWESKQIVQRFLLGMTTLAKALRIVPGQKQFILFSSGIPSSLLYGNQAGTPMGNKDSSGSWLPGSKVLFETGDPVLRSQAEEMNKEFAASGCSFFVFDTRLSAMKTSMFDRESQTLETGNRAAMFTPTSAFEVASIYKSDRITGLETLTQLAKATGGEYFSNIDRYEKNFDQVQAVTGSFYVLGFPVNERWDGKFHEVKVEVKRKGCEVRAQAGYFNPKPFSEYSDLEKQLHLFDLALNERAFSRLPLSVPMTTLTAAAEGITRLAVLAKVPAEVTEKLSGSRVEFVTIFFDANGEIGDVVREERDLGRLRGKELAFGAGAILRPGDYACRLVIRDMTSGLSAVASAKATVGKQQMTALSLGTPLMLGPGAGRTFVYAAAKKGRAAFPWSEIYPYDSSLFSPIVGELPPAAESIQVVIPCAVPGGGKPELAISAYLIDTRTGARSAVPIVRSDNVTKGPLEILTLELATADLAPGTYYLHFNAQDRATGALGHTFTTLTVKEAGKEGRQ
jgi:VWFA-related protein